HAGNIIASGDHPFLVDLEALFHPRRSLSDSGDRGAHRLARLAMSNSVLRIGLLPERGWSNTECEGIDLSGLGTLEDQVTPHGVPQWEAVGTDAMRLVRRRKPVHPGKNRPRLRGSAVNVLDYRQSILDGFAATYSGLLAHRDELVSNEGPLA